MRAGRKEAGRRTSGLAAGMEGVGLVPGSGWAEGADWRAGRVGAGHQDWQRAAAGSLDRKEDGRAGSVVAGS